MQIGLSSFINLPQYSRLIATINNMLILIYAKVTANQDIVFKSHPVISALSSNAGWITMELDSFSDQQMITLAGRLMEQSTHTVLLLDVEDASGTATPFAPLLERISKNTHHFLLRNGGVHYLVDRISSQITAEQIKTNLSNDEVMEFIRSLS